MEWKLRPFSAAALARPVGDLGNGINGYSVVDSEGSGTSACCSSKRCVGEDGPAPARQVPKPSQAILGALAADDQLGGATTSTQSKAAGKPDPLDGIQGQ